MTFKTATTTTFFLTAFLLHINFLNPVFGQDDQSYSEKQGEIGQILDDISGQRDKEIEDSLLLSIPEITDNPNHILTFTDPSGKGVFLDIDGQGFKEVTSPNTLPSLGIGDHTLLFKFTDKNDAVKTIEKSLVVIPRVPVIKPPVKNEDGTITFTGTALVNSEVELYLSGSSKTYNLKATVDKDQNWTVNTTEVLENGIFNIVGIARKNGYSSTFSEPVIFEITQEDITEKEKPEEKAETSFNFTDITKDNYKSIFKKNPDLGILAGGALLVGLILGFILDAALARKQSKAAEKMLKSMLGTDGAAKLPSEGEKKVVAEKKPKTMFGSITSKINPTHLPVAAEPIKTENRKLTLREKFQLAGAKVNDMSVEQNDELIADSVENQHQAVEDAVMSSVEDEMAEARDENSLDHVTSGMFAKLNDASTSSAQVENETSEEIEKKAKEKGSDPEFKTEEPTIESESDEKEVMTKEEFLKRYKNFDPDAESVEIIQKQKKAESVKDTKPKKAAKAKKKVAKAKKEDVKEVKQEPTSKNIKISLTSSKLD